MESLRDTICWPGWEIVRPLGSGGFGKVYEIRKADETGEYRAAMKVIAIPNSASDYEVYEDDGYDEESITAIFKSQMEDIAREFSLMAQFKGVSNIVSYEEHLIVPHDDGRGWDILIRMELLTPLPQYCKMHTMTEKDVIRLGMDICRALELCGKKKVIHRDIKPQNLFINDFDDFKLGDFGISKTLDHTTKATKTGTSSYMAPEVYNGQAYGSSVDIYSLGLVLYWLLNERKLPFMPIGKVPSHSEIERAVERRYKGEAFPPPKNGSAELKAVVMKACAFAPQDRFATAGEMREALDAVLHGAQSIPVYKATPVYKNEPVQEEPVHKEETVREAPVVYKDEPVQEEETALDEGTVGGAFYREIEPEPAPLIEDDDGGTVGGFFYHEPVPEPEPEPKIETAPLIEEDDGGTVGGFFYREPVPEPKPEPKIEPAPKPKPEPEPKVTWKRNQSDDSRQREEPIQLGKRGRGKRVWVWGALGILVVTGCACAINVLLGVIVFVLSTSVFAAFAGDED